MQVLKEPKRKSCFVSIENGFAGVYSSEQGPVFFENRNKYLFIDKSVQFIIKEKLDHNEFVIIKDGIDVFSSNYVPPAVDELDPWSDEESVDFYLWAARKKDDVEFIQMWTL